MSRPPKPVRYEKNPMSEGRERSGASVPENLLQTPVRQEIEQAGERQADDVEVIAPGCRVTSAAPRPWIA